MGLQVALENIGITISVVGHKIGCIRVEHY